MPAHKKLIPELVAYFSGLGYNANQLARLMGVTHHTITRALKLTPKARRPRQRGTSPPKPPAPPLPCCCGLEMTPAKRHNPSRFCFVCELCRAERPRYRAEDTAPPPADSAEQAAAIRANPAAYGLKTRKISAELDKRFRK